MNNPLNLNEPQLESLERIKKTLEWCHHVDVIVRKDGQNHHFEMDYLPRLLNLLDTLTSPDKL